MGFGSAFHLVVLLMDKECPLEICQSQCDCHWTNVLLQPASVLGLETLDQIFCPNISNILPPCEPVCSDHSV